jgi:hypothetical protein
VAREPSKPPGKPVSSKVLTLAGPVPGSKYVRDVLESDPALLLDHLKKMPRRELQRLFDQPPPTHGRRRGTKPKHDWKKRVWREALRRIAKKGSVPDNVSAFAKELAVYSQQQWGWEPDDSDLRGLLTQLIDPPL